MARMPHPAPAPRLQCSTGPFWGYELEAAFDAVADAGFTEVELMVNRDPTTHHPDLPARLAAERGLQISSVHGPFLTLTKGVWGANPKVKVRRGIEMCRALGAACLIVHPPLLWEREYARWLCTEAETLIAESRIEIAVETMYPKWMVRRRVSGYRWTEPRDLLHAAPRVAMDTSHVTVARQDVCAVYALLSPKLVHIHLSDSLGDGRDRHLELGAGNLPIDRLLAELLRTQYSGGLSLELSVRDYHQRPVALVSALQRNRQYVMSALSPDTREEKRIAGE
jgi:sugar phosphate isomerase/epimerase